MEHHEPTLVFDFHAPMVDKATTGGKDCHTKLQIYSLTGIYPEKNPPESNQATVWTSNRI